DGSTSRSAMKQCAENARAGLNQNWRLEATMDFTIPDDILALKERTEHFVREQIMPRESDPRQTPHGPTEEFRCELVSLAQQAGLVAPHVGREWGGLGLDDRGKAIVFEAAGYSPLATIAMN